MTTTPRELALAYVPTERQAVAHRRAQEGVREIFYGGAAYGAKSYWLVNECHIRCVETPGRKVVIFRRTLNQLQEVILPLMRKLAAELPGMAQYYASRKEIVYRHPQGESVFGVRYAETPADVERHKGASWDTIGIDEAGDWTWAEVSGLFHPLRAPEGSGITPQLLLTSNPWGVGFHWLKQRYVDPAQAHQCGDQAFRVPASDEDPHPSTRCYIMSTVDDNPYASQEYKEQLDRIADRRKRMALRFGVWDLPADDETLFQPGVVDAMQQGAWGARPVPEPGHKYVHLWDVARKRDWTVGITLDVTQVPVQIVAMDRFRYVDWPIMGQRIAERHRQYKATTATSLTIYDSTGVGDPLGQYLEIPLGELRGFQFTGPSKAKAVDALVLACNEARIKGPRVSGGCIRGIENLWMELSLYKADDKKLTQDCVMALAMGAWDQRQKVVAASPGPRESRRRETGRRLAQVGGVGWMR